MFHSSTSIFTPLAEVSIFFRKEIVGAFAENIFNKIPCRKNSAGDFCFDKSNLIEKQKRLALEQKISVIQQNKLALEQRISALQQRSSAEEQKVSAPRQKGSAKEQKVSAPWQNTSKEPS